MVDAAIMKRLILLISGFIIVLVLLIIFTFIRKKGPTPDPITPPISPSPTTLKFINSTPQNGATNVNINTKIIINFNQPVTEENIQLLLWPKVEYEAQYNNKTATIIPTTQLEEGTPYRVTLVYSYTDIPDVITFTTIGTRTAPLPDTGPDDEAIKRVEEEERINRPDIFLKNRTPYSEENFSIEGEYDGSVGQFAFTVTIPQNIGMAQGRQAATMWMKAFGLIDPQIQNLKITYSTSP